jgi:rod shape-determining protein MreD
MSDSLRWSADADRSTIRPGTRPVAATRSPDGQSVGLRVLFAILLFVLALLQATFIPALGIMGVTPNFALVFLLIWSAARGTREGLIWAFALGLWLDLLAMDPLGTHAIGLLAVAVIGGAVRGRFFRSGAILPLLAVVVATMAYGVIEIVIHLFQGDAVNIAGALRLALLVSLLNALLVPLAYGVLLVIERWMPRRVS